MVADKTMYEFYKGGLEEYLLTIANMVSFHCFADETSCQTYLFYTFVVSIVRDVQRTVGTKRLVEFHDSKVAYFH